MLGLVHAVLFALAVAVTAAGDKAARLPAKVASSSGHAKLRRASVSTISPVSEGGDGVDDDADNGIEDDSNDGDLEDNADEVDEDSADHNDTRSGVKTGPSPTPMRRGFLSRLASSKLAPIQRQLQSAMTGQGFVDDQRLGSPLDKDNTTTGVDEDTEVSAPGSGSGFMFMVVAFVLRIGMSLLMLWFQMRRRGGAEGTDTPGGIFDSVSKDSLLGSVVAQVQHGFSYIAAFARSPSAAPVMIALLILGTKLIKGMDAEPEIEAEGAVEVIDAEEELADSADGDEEAADAEAAMVQEVGEEPLSAAGGNEEADVDLRLGQEEVMDGDTEDNEEE
mmetsp:Transcript_47276/g.102654  ORF Transcript_47276/g.102654 Transcript_47276/m.102654 type:complete len:334 (-) Transcript_47276:192-1193(-)